MLRGPVVLLPLGFIINKSSVGRVLTGRGKLELMPAEQYTNIHHFAFKLHTVADMLFVKHGA